MHVWYKGPGVWQVAVEFKPVPCTAVRGHQGAKLQGQVGEGGDSSFLDANYPPQLTVGRRPPRGGFREGRRGGGGGLGGAWRGAPGGSVGGGVQGAGSRGRFGVVVGGGPGGPIWGGGGGGGAKAPVTSPCTPSNHTITITRIEYWDRAGGGGTSSRRLQRQMRYALESG